MNACSNDAHSNQKLSHASRNRRRSGSICINAPVLSRHLRAVNSAQLLACSKISDHHPLPDARLNSSGRGKQPKGSCLYHVPKFFCLLLHDACDLCLLLVLLQVLVGEEGEGAAEQDHGVQADAHVGVAGAAGAGLRGALLLLGFGGGIVGLRRMGMSVREFGGGNGKRGAILSQLQCSAIFGSMVAQRWGSGGGKTYAALESADEQTLEDLAGLVTVADILECLGGVLATDVEEDLLTTGVLVNEACNAQRGQLRSLVMLAFWRYFAR